MTVFFAVLVVVFMGGQTGFSQQNSQDPYSEELVTAMASRAGFVMSVQEKAVNRLGDRAAIGFVRRLGVQTPSSSQEVEGILFVVRMAFAAPQIIGTDADREPKATLLLLRYLDCLPASGSAKSEIESTRAYVLQQVNEYKRKRAEE